MAEEQFRDYEQENLNESNYKQHLKEKYRIVLKYPFFKMRRDENENARRFVSLHLRRNRVRERRIEERLGVHIDASKLDCSKDFVDMDFNDFMCGHFDDEGHFSNLLSQYL